MFAVVWLCIRTALQNLQYVGMDHQTVFALAVIGTADETAHAHLGTNANLRDLRLQRLSTGDDLYAADRFAIPSGCALTGTVLQDKARNRDTGRAAPDLRGTTYLPRNH